MTVKVFYENKTDPTKSFSQKFEDVDRIEEVEQVIDHQDEFADHHEYVYYNYDLFNEKGIRLGTICNAHAAKIEIIPQEGWYATWLNYALQNW